MPKKRVNVGIVGAAFMGKAHSVGYRDVAFAFPDVKAVPVRKEIAAITLAEAEVGREQFGWERASEGYQGLIGKKDIDLVDVCTGNNLHCEVVLAAAKAGKGSSSTTTASLSFPSLSPSTTVKPHPFGQTVSALRHAGDHTPAAVLMGKKVPGYYATTTTAPESTTTTEESTTTTTSESTATSVLSATQGSAAGDAVTGNAQGPKISAGKAKPNTPTAVLKGKKVPGQSK